MSTVALKGVSDLKSRDARWYLPEFADRRGERVQQVAAHFWRESRPRRENYARYWSLYSNLPLPGLTPRKYSQRVAGLAKGRLCLNACSSVVDAYVGMVTAQRPKVMFATSGADWDLQQRAKSLEKFNEGVLYENDFYEMTPLLEADVGILGTGIVKTYADSDGPDARIIHERLMPFYLFCDDEEAQAGDPRWLGERRYIDRLVAMATWPEFATEIATAAREAEDPDEGYGDDPQTDTVCVTEMFHIPSGRGRWGRGGRDTGDGMHCIVVGTTVVLEEDCQRFPYEMVYAQLPESGIWGRGFVEQIQGIQYEINVIMNMIRAAFRIAGSVRWITEASCMLNFLQVSDIIGGRMTYTGPTAPQPLVPPAIGQEVYSHLDRLWQKAFEVPGISLLTATSKAPPDEESGKAKQLRLDTETERFQVAVHQYFNLPLRLARNQTIPLARELGEKNAAFSVKCITKRTMSVVKWADAHLCEDDYAIKLYPVSAFSDDPEARMQDVEDALNSASPLITPQEGRRLLNDPDLEEFESLADASYDLTMQMVTDILTRGKYQPPEPLMDLADAVKRAQMAYLKGRRAGAPEDRLQMLLEWMEQCKGLMPPPPVAPPPPPGPPMPHPMMNGAPPGAGPQPQAQMAA